MKIEVKNLTKKFKEEVVIDHINLTFDVGHIYGLYGRNGAGKSIFLKLLCGFYLPTEGEVLFDGINYNQKKEFPESLRALIEKPSFFPDMTGFQNLKLLADIQHKITADDILKSLDIVNLLEEKDKKYGKYSLGMKQKLALCCALIHKPEVLFLDEPTTGVDPVSRKEFWEMLKRLKAEGITMVVSTPYMDEARLCDRIALIKDGRFMSINSPDNIIADFRVPLWAAKSQHMYHLLNDLRAYPDIDNCYVSGEYHHFTTRGEGFDTDALNRYLTSKGHAAEVKQIEATIEDCYMHLAKTASRESE